jgi:hypothetical protein
MRSPFPGMDPYLEDPAFWRDFHHRFLDDWCDAIADQLPDHYEARLDETVNLVHMEEATKRIYPDVAVSRKRRGSPPKTRAAGALLLEPVTIPHEYLDEERQAQIKILHRPNRTLIAVLELLSPTNKNGDGFEEYRGKRRAVLGQDVHLVELDLLLGGVHPPLAEPLPAGDYYLFISRADQRPNCQVSGWNLRDPLPTMPIPLQTPDKDVHVDLGKVFATTYQRGRYSRSLAYGKAPVAPLRSADAAWAKRISMRK